MYVLSRCAILTPTQVLTIARALFVVLVEGGVCTSTGNVIRAVLEGIATYPCWPSMEEVGKEQVSLEPTALSSLIEEALGAGAILGSPPFCVFEVSNPLAKLDPFNACRSGQLTRGGLWLLSWLKEGRREWEQRKNLWERS